MRTSDQLGFKQDWGTKYARAKELDDRDLEEKLLKIAEEAPEPVIEHSEPRVVQSPAVSSNSTAMGRLARDGVRRFCYSEICVQTTDLRSSPVHEWS
jgi:hypothetical protein